MVVRTNAVGALLARAWPARILRSLAASLLALIPAIFGHRFGGGEIASGVVTGAAVVAVLVLTFWHPTGRRRSRFETAKYWS